ncbi:outer arm dynein light chain 1, partial [Martensiomyces pterosporus]
MPSTRDAAVQAPSATLSTTADSDADAYTPACLLSRRRDATAKAATDSLALAASATEGRYRSGSGVDVTDDRKCVHVSLFDIEHGNVNLSQKGVSALLPRIAIYAQTITYLNLSCNALKSLPDEIGHLYRLKELDVSGNQLESLPTTLAYCQQLRWIDASANQLVDLPTSIRHIHSLATLNLAGNSLEAVPRCLWRLRNLKSLDLSCNLIRVLPARMFMPGGAAAPNTGTLSMLVLDGCPLGSGFTDHIRNPSLVITSRFKHGLPDHLQERLDSLVQCDGCHALYPAGSGVTRLRLLYRNKTIWPIEYNFCKPHWSNERQRIASLF